MEWSWLYQSGPEVPAVWRLVRFAVILYVVLAGFAHLHANRALYPRPQASYRDSDRIIKLPHAEGHVISAVFLDQPSRTPIILYSHGNAEDLGLLLPFLEEFHRRGYRVLAYDYSGYGTSEGVPSEKTTYRDIHAAYTHLVHTEGIYSNDIFLYGRSLGGGVATDLATRVPVGGLILESTFTSAYRVMTRIAVFPFDKYNNINKIQNLSCPVFIIHGREDHIIPITHAEKLLAAAPEPKTHLWVDGAGHNDMSFAFGEAYWRQIAAFTGNTGEGE